MNHPVLGNKFMVSPTKIYKKFLQVSCLLLRTELFSSDESDHTGKLKKIVNIFSLITAQNKKKSQAWFQSSAVLLIF